MGLIRRGGGEALLTVGDVSKAADVEMMIRQTVDHYGGLDCASTTPALPIPTTPSGMRRCSARSWM